MRLLEASIGPARVHLGVDTCILEEQIRLAVSTGSEAVTVSSWPPPEPWRKPPIPIPADFIPSRWLPSVPPAIGAIHPEVWRHSVLCSAFCVLESAQPKCLAFCMSAHSRLGSGSVWRGLARKKKELIDTLEKHSIDYTDEFELLVYDSPYKVVNRRKEVLVELK